MKFLLVVLCLIGCGCARKLPSFIDVCNPKATDVSKCILGNIEKLRPQLKGKDGIKELGIPSINPLLIPHAELKLGSNFNAQLNDIHLYEISDFILEELKVNLDNPDDIQLDIKVKFNHVDAKADYKVNGEVLVLKLDGFGAGNINITNLVGYIVGKGKKENRNGKDHIKIKSIDIKADVGHLDILLENLFPKNPELTANSNKLLNENQSILVEEFAPLIINIVKDFIGNVLTNTFDRYSYDVLFPGA